MINLEPIPKKIQERLKEKMNVMGRTRPISPNESKSKSVDYGLTHAKMATRSTFLRMTSGQLNPVILMGGKLKDDGTIPGGYKDIYGQRTYRTGGSTDITETLTADTNAFVPIGETIDVVTKATKATSYNTVNNLKRPTPGVKSVEASFKGGVKANREATISWTCWDWTELDLLMPHFLAHGKTVLVEWGWVYDKATLQNLPNFVKTDTAGNKFISADVYNNYKNKVVDENGDFDLMVGVIKNFEYTTRDDGGFDCQTIISSVGVNLLDTEEPNKGYVDPSIIYNINVKDTKELSEELETASGTNEDTLIQLNSNIAFKAFLSQIDNYLVTLLKDTKTEKEVYYEPNKFVIQAKEVKKSSGTNTKMVDLTTIERARGLGVEKAWVRWGWFEDNILSKFISLTSIGDGSSTKQKNDIISQFRSVENILDNGGKETGKFQSVKIRNNINLETVDINSYILPGQFNPLDSRTITGKSRESNTGPTINRDYSESKTYDINLSGDKKYLLDLKSVINETENFSTFATFEENIDPETKKVKKIKRYIKDGKSESVDSPGKFGYLRNMLINTETIKEAFDAKTVPDKAESINIFEAIERMFNTLNAAGGLNLWNYNIVQDDTDHQRVKIIDETTTAIDFTKPVKDQKTKFINNTTISSEKSGIFYFPVWQHDSIVKRQNVNAKVPSSLQIATMYGSNVDALSSFGNTDSNFSAEGVAAGAISNKDADKRLKGINIAIKNTDSMEIGLKSGNSEEPLTLDGGEDILTFLSSESVQSILSANYSALDEDIKQRIENLDKATRDKKIDDIYTKSEPTPSLDFIDDDSILNLLDFNKFESTTPIGPQERKQVIEDIEKTFGSKFNGSGIVKSEFLDGINENITRFGNTSNENIPLLIPLELELDIDGIGGIYPGNSFHSTYVPVRYQDYTVFQAKEVNHRLDSTGWTTTISGIMRTSLNQLLIEQNKSISTETKRSLKNYKEKVRQQVYKKNVNEEKKAAGTKAADKVNKKVSVGTSGGFLG